jgi:alkylation response protein AidB-like acyl-CoA dehydrogenase
MDFSIPEDVVSVRDLAGQILSENIDDGALRSFDRHEIRWHERAWSLLAEAGLLGVALPESCGGSGLGFLALCAVLEEQGRHVAALPLLSGVVLGALPLARFGNDAQKAAWLPRLVEGKALLSAALARSPLDPLPQALPRQAVDGASIRLDGELGPVPWGHEADGVLVAARAGDGSVDVYLVERGAAGLSAEVARGTDHEPFATLRLAGVQVDASARIGAPGAGADILAWVAGRAGTAIGFRQLGVLEEALKRTAAHTVERRQFGKPIAGFQAVAHRAADAYIDLEALRAALWQAAWRLDQELPAGNAVATAAWWASEAGHRVGHACQHLHGGTGADLDYPIHRYYLWAQQNRLCLGGSARILGDLGAQLSTQQIEIGL